MMTQELEVKGGGEEIRLKCRIDTSEKQRLNWERTTGNDGFSPKREWRCAVSIPVEEAMRLWALKDIDWLAWNHNLDDDAAFKRLLARYPHWRCAEGGIV